MKKEQLLNVLVNLDSKDQHVLVSSSYITLQKKMTFSIKDFFSKCDQTRRKLRIWSRFLKKSLMLWKRRIFSFFCTVLVKTFFQLQNLILEKSIWLTHLSQTSMMKLFAKNLLIIFAKGFILDICLHAKCTVVCCLLTRILFSFYCFTCWFRDVFL